LGQSTGEIIAKVNRATLSIVAGGPLKILIFILSSAFFSGQAMASDKVIKCTAKTYYLFADGLRASVQGGPPGIQISISSADEDRLTADLSILREPVEHRSGRGVERNAFSTANLGPAEFKQALERMAGAAGDDRILQSDAYTAYGVKRVNGEIFVVVFSFTKAGREVARTLMWTDAAQPVAVCSEMDPGNLNI
jgi:hypothetical protein